MGMPEWLSFFFALFSVSLICSVFLLRPLFLKLGGSWEGYKLGRLPGRLFFIRGYDQKPSGERGEVWEWVSEEKKKMVFWVSSTVLRPLTFILFTCFSFLFFCNGVQVSLRRRCGYWDRRLLFCVSCFFFLKFRGLERMERGDPLRIGFEAGRIGSFLGIVDVEVGDEDGERDFLNWMRRGHIWKRYRGGLM